MASTAATYPHIAAIARACRRRTLAFTLANGGGYLAQGCSGAEILATLYAEVLNLGEVEGSIDAVRLPAPGEAPLPAGARYNGPAEAGRDRFFLGCCHYAVALYATLVEVGRLSEEAFSHAGHDAWNMDIIASEFTPGCETNSGSLGQAISVAAGVAHAYKLQRKAGRIFCMISDGELDEGQDWECAQLAAQLKLDNLIVLVDVNHMQAEGWTSTILDLEPLEARFASFGWAALRVSGHEPAEIIAACETEHVDKPLVILCDTNPAQGIAAMRNVVPCHYVHITDELRPTFEAAYEELCRNE